MNTTAWGSRTKWEGAVREKKRRFTRKKKKIESTLKKKFKFALISQRERVKNILSNNKLQMIALVLWYRTIHPRLYSAQGEVTCRG